MTLPAFGFAALHEDTAWTSTETRTAFLDLLVDGHWRGALRYILLVATPGQRVPRRPGLIPAKRLRDEVGALLTDPAVLDLLMVTGREMTDDSEALDTERMPLYGGTRVLTHGTRGGVPEGADAWVDDVVRFMDRSAATAGVVVALANQSEVTTECSRTTVGRNFVPVHPWPEQAARMKGENASHLGTRYMRFPRWGTLVSHGHVAALGGLDAIVAAIRPARTQALSGGVFIQLTDSPTTAMGDEALAKQRAFIELAAPLLPPAKSPLLPVDVAAEVAE